MQITVNEIAALVNGMVEGDGTQIITHPAKIEEAGKGGLSFLANPKYQNFVYTTHATALLVSNDIVFNGPVAPVLIRVKDAYGAMAQLLEIYQSQLMQQKRGIESPVYIDGSTSLPADIYIGAFAYIGRNVSLGKNVKIFPQVYIGDGVQIGDDTVLHPGVKIYDACIIGKRCTIHSGTVIGSDGFGFAPQPDGSYKKVPQTGNVIIEDNVEIGSNTTVDRATMGSTVIHAGTKLDNLIQVAHNVEIGAHTVIAAQTGISGSTKIGQYCRIGGQAGLSGHLTIADNTQIQAQSGVAQSIHTPGSSISGAPAIEYRQWQRASIAFKQLPEMIKKMRATAKPE